MAIDSRHVFQSTCSMLSLKAQALFLAVALVLALAPGQAAQADTHTAPDVSFSIELIAPPHVEAGESFTVYAKVENQGEQSLVYPAILRKPETYRNVEAGYRFLSCSTDCISVSEIAAGQTVYMTVGSFRYVDGVFAAGELAIDDFQFRYLWTDGLENQFIDLSSSLNVEVQHTSGINDNPVLDLPSRTALQIHDLLEAGDELRLHDPNTGKDWVRFDASSSLVTEEVLAALAPGGDFEEYELARISQVEQLVINHMHASGLALQLEDVEALAEPAVINAMLEFIDLVQPTSGFGDLRIVRGAVADGRMYWEEDAGSIGGLTLAVNLQSSHHCGCASPRGISRSSFPLQLWQSPRSNQGVWLVKSPEPTPVRPVHRASFFDNELVIPAVRIDGVDFRVTLRLTDSHFDLLRVGALEPTTTSAEPVHFHADSGTVYLPEVIVIDNGGETSIGGVTLTLIEHTGTRLMQIVQMGH